MNKCVWEKVHSLEKINKDVYITSCGKRYYISDIDNIEHCDSCGRIVVKEKISLIEQVNKYYVYNCRPLYWNDDRIDIIRAMYEEIIEKMKNCYNCYHYVESSSTEDDFTCEYSEICTINNKWRLYEGKDN